MVKEEDLKLNTNYLTNYGVLQYVGKPTEKDNLLMEELGYDTEVQNYLKFKVEGKHGLAFISDLKYVYCEYGFKYYKTKDKYLTIDVPLIKVQTAEYIGDLDLDYTCENKRKDEDILFKYGIPKEDLEGIEYGINEDPFKTKIFGINEDDTIKEEVVDEFFKSNHKKANTFLQEFNEYCAEHDMVGYSKQKNDLWVSKLEEHKQLLIEKEADLTLEIQSLQAKTGDLLNNLMDLLAKDGVNTFKRGEEWSYAVEDILDTYDNLVSDDNPNKEYLEDTITQGKADATHYLEETRQQLSNLCNVLNPRTEELITTLEEQQKRLRVKVARNYKQKVEKEFDEIMKMPSETIDDYHRQAEAMEKAYKEWNEASETIEGYQADIQQSLEFELQRMHPQIFKALYLDVLHYEKARW